MPNEPQADKTVKKHRLSKFKGLEENRIEDSQKVQASFLEHLFENAPEAIALLDNDHKITMINSAFVKMFGYTLDEAKGKILDELIAPGRIFEEASKLTQRVDSGETVRMEAVRYRKDGNPVDVELMSTPIFSGDEKIALYGSYRDISERKKAERDLKEKEERYRLVSDLTSDYAYAFRVEADGTLINEWVTGALKKITGRSETEISSRGGWRSLIVPDDLAIPLQQLEALKKNESQVVEYRIFNKANKVRWMRDYARPLWDHQQNRLKYIYGAIQDITDRKLVEKELEVSHETLLTILDGINATIYVSDLDTYEILFMNRHMKDIFGHQFEGKLCHELFRAKDGPCDHCTTPKLLDEAGRPTGVITWEGQNPLTGRWYINYDRAIPWVDNRLVRLQVATDITDLKDAEQTLRTREKLFRSIFEQSLIGMALTNPEMHFIKVNDRLCEIFGYPQDKLLQKTFVDMTHSDDFAENEFYFKAVMAGKKDSYTLEKRFIRGDGTIFHARMFTQCLRRKDKSIDFFVTLIEDISEQKTLETQLHQAQKLEAIGTLAGGMAHDFNNLLMGIQGRTSLMRLDTTAQHPHHEHLNGIEANVKSAARLTRQLLGFARGGKYEVKPSDINKILTKCAELFGRTKKGISIHIKEQTDIRTVEIDRSQIDQVLLNLFVNAGQAMSDSGNLWLETENVTLEPAFVKPHGTVPGRYVKISVTDTGIGMDEITKQRAFDPFFTTKEKDRGTGLGLASTYGIIKNHRGIIEFFTKLGKGTTFNIYLPVSKKGIVPEKRLSEKMVRGTETILLVDDEETIIEVGQDILKALGYRVIAATNGKSGIETYLQKKDEISLVLLDMVMPEMGGAETFERLKNINPNIKVLLSSGYSIDGLAKKLLEKGCNGFIQKPFGLKELSQKIRDIIDKT